MVAAWNFHASTSTLNSVGSTAQIVAEALHALLQDGVLILVLITREQLVDPSERHSFPVLRALLPPHVCGDGRSRGALHRHLGHFGAIEYDVGGGLGHFLFVRAARTAAAFFTVRFPSILFTTFTAQRGCWVFTFSHTLPHVSLALVPVLVVSCRRSSLRSRRPLLDAAALAAGQQSPCPKDSLQSHFNASLT